MCGRMTQLESSRVVEELCIAVNHVPAGEPLRYNVSPTELVRVVRIRDRARGRELELLRWGLVPSWAKDRSSAARAINARAETLASKPSFRDALGNRRCLVVADGFYEWQALGRTKQPFYVRRTDGALLAMAGLWDSWTSADGEVIETCTVITKPAVAPVVEIHDRMPAILGEANHDAWLEPSPLPRGALEEMLLAPSPELRAEPVSTRVNKAANDGPECIARVATSGSLFDWRPPG